ncbi:hypothetical protein K474DRAFT_1591862 [Panus rudis PR-1116 ss-1]|nr:hypothetical protein K474DRAFT_1591862 [Panus rudis PR-1116 ss-1]
MASSTTAATSIGRASAERVQELRESLADIRGRVLKAAENNPVNKNPTLVAVSKYKPASDVLACFEDGQRDFGENYVQELVDKAAQLPREIRWHFIGTLQSNKAKTLATIPNLHAIQTVTSIKAANVLNKYVPTERTTPLNILIQVNTSGEENKSGLPPLTPSSSDVDSSELVQLAKHIISQCPRLHIQGLMTIGSIEQSLAAAQRKENHDFETLIQTRDVLQNVLQNVTDGKWGEEGRLLISMGMSSDFEAALKYGSDIVRVGTGIFGVRPKKEEVKHTSS